MFYKIQGGIRPEGGSLYIMLSKIRIAVLDTSAFDDYLYLNRINVPDDYQNRGVGSALVEAMKVSARRSGHTRIIVEPGGYDPKRQNDRLRFYKKHGFTEHPDGFLFLSL